MFDKREDGRVWENLALDFLRKRGMIILERNYSVKGAEIDLIYKDGDYLCFAEVKHRKTSDFGNPYEAVNYGKRKRICKASRLYLYRNHYSDNTLVRYDIISILGSDISFFENAFGYC